MRDLEFDLPYVCECGVCVGELLKQKRDTQHSSYSYVTRSMKKSNRRRFLIGIRLSIVSIYNRRRINTII